MLLKQSLPEWTVREAGAPKELWTEIISPPYSDNLFYDVIWVDKTPTRLPEVRWASHAPAASGSCRGTATGVESATTPGPRVSAGVPDASA